LFGRAHLSDVGTAPSLRVFPDTANAGHADFYDSRTAYASHLR
jgi:hypothetical protein